jgi:hypothetical protein
VQMRGLESLKCDRGCCCCCCCSSTPHLGSVHTPPGANERA